MDNKHTEVCVEKKKEIRNKARNNQGKKEGRTERYIEKWPCLSPRRPGFDPGSVHVGFVVDKVALGQVFPRVLRFSPVDFIPLVLHYTEKR
jgi:hypothetical protein